MKYIVKKIGTLIGTLLLISFLSFLAFTIIPGDPAVSMLGTEATPERLEALREEMGLNDPVLVRYGNWLKDFAMGDMGTSYSYHVSVREMIGDKFVINIVLTILSFTIILLISIPGGVLSAQYHDSWIDKIFTACNQIIMGFPAFFLGIIVTYVFGLVLKWFTPGGYVSYKDSIGGFISYLILPGVAIALPKSAMVVKLLKNSIEKELNADYVRTARSRGNTRNHILYSHVLRNAFIPVLTFLGMIIADIVAGSIIIEQVFGIPGIGRLLISSIGSRDYPVVQAIIVIIAFIIVLINFIVDILYRVIDPRIRIS